jgi:hypothetical protein
MPKRRAGTIALVVPGQALRAFLAASANPGLSRRAGQFAREGLLAACGNTMKSLPPRHKSVPEPRLHPAGMLRRPARTTGIEVM